MALSNEDKKDVQGAMGKAIANKVSKVTRDTFKAPGHKRRLTHRTITDDAGGRTVEFGGRANYLRSKPRTITLKSGEEIIAGKKYRSPRKEKPLKSWGDDLPRMNASKSKALQGKKSAESGMMDKWAKYKASPAYKKDKNEPY